MKNNGCTYEPGNVVYFHHLHMRPDRVKHDPYRDKNGRTWCRVEGKARRMLILRRCLRPLFDTARITNEPSGTNQCVWYKVETRGVGYWVLSLSSKAPPQKYLRCPDLVDRGKVSFVDLAPVCYPAESVCQYPDQRPHAVEERLFGMIIKEIGLRALGCPDNRA